MSKGLKLERQTPVQTKSELPQAPAPMTRLLHDKGPEWHSHTQQWIYICNDNIEIYDPVHL